MNNSTKLERFKILCKITIPFIIVYFLMAYVLGVVVVRGDSMLPTYSDYDTVLILRIGYTPEYDDVLVCSSSNYPIIKRVIGKPGDILDIQDGMITVNSESTGILDTVSQLYGTIEMPHIVANNSYFVVGDNHALSRDSRFNDIGDIHHKNIQGKVILTLRRATNE